MTVTIKKGNWDAVNLADHISQALLAVDNMVVYDPLRLAFSFSKEVDIYPPIDDPYGVKNKQILSILGYPTPPTSHWSIYNTMLSEIPIKLSGPSCIHINTNLPLFNVPVSGRLATVGVTANYGDLILFQDLPSAQPAYLTSQYFDKLSIQLTDENNEELEGYDDIPWSAVISLDPVEDSGFKQMGLDRGNIETNGVL